MLKEISINPELLTVTGFFDPSAQISIAYVATDSIEDLIGTLNALRSAQLTEAAQKEQTLLDQQAAEAEYIAAKATDNQATFESKNEQAD